MNILFFHTNGIMPESGGISRTTFNLGNNLRNHGHIVYYLGYTKTNDKYNYDASQSFVPVEYKKTKETTAGYIERYLQKYSIDVVINQNPFSSMFVDILYLATSKLNIKVISCYHNSILTPIYNFAYQRECYLKKKHLGFLFPLLKTRIITNLLVWYYIKKYGKVYSNTVKKSYKTVLLCAGLKEELIKITGIKDEDKYAVIPNMMPEFAYGNEDAKHNIILWVGTFDSYVKRPDLALKVWNRLYSEFEDWELHLLGDGPAYKDTKELSKQLGLERIYFEGRIDPYPFYRKAKLIMVTSTHESFSLVTVEAMANKCVPVVFNSFPAAEMILNNNLSELLVPAFSEKLFAKKMKELMKNSVKLAELSKDSQDASRDYNAENVYSMWIDLLRKHY